MRTLFILSLTLLFACKAVAQEPDKWQFKGEKEGIKIYHQRTPGLLHIKLSTTFQVPLAGIVTLFTDVSTYPRWCYKLAEVKMLRKVSDTEMFYYAKYDFPWPLDDRDIILHSKIEQDPKTKWIRITNTPYPDYIPEKTGIVRIKNTTTRWLFIPGEGGWVYTEQQISTDSAENVPNWLVDFTADTGPRETAKGVRRVLREARYQEASLPHIKEK